MFTDRREEEGSKVESEYSRLRNSEIRHEVYLLFEILNSSALLKTSMTLLSLKLLQHFARI